MQRFYMKVYTWNYEEMKHCRIASESVTFSYIDKT